LTVDQVLVDQLSLFCI